MHAEINRQPDEHRQKSDRQDVQVADGQRRKRHRVGQTDHQADRRFDRPPRFTVAVDENERDEHQRHDRGHGCVVLRLRHFIILQHRLAGNAHIDSRHFGLCLRHQLAQPLHGLVVQLFAQRAGRGDVDSTVGEGHIDLLLSLLPGVEQRRQPG